MAFAGTWSCCRVFCGVFCLGKKPVLGLFGLDVPLGICWYRLNWLFFVVVYVGFFFVGCFGGVCITCGFSVSPVSPGGSLVRLVYGSINRAACFRAVR